MGPGGLGREAAKTGGLGLLSGGASSLGGMAVDNLLGGGKSNGAQGGQGAQGASNANAAYAQQGANGQQANGAQDPQAAAIQAILGRLLKQGGGGDD